jgi:hypothetical protein
MLWLVFDVVLKSDEKNTGIFADAYQGTAGIQLAPSKTFVWMFILSYFKVPNS